LLEAVGATSVFSHAQSSRFLAAAQTQAPPPLYDFCKHVSFPDYAGGDSMKFEDAVSKIPNITDLRRTAKAHVVDHKQLSNDQLGAAIVKSMPQYVHPETIGIAIAELFSQEPRADLRGLA
jgi:hypothetical protein